jgi:hypothetical protein
MTWGVTVPWQLMVSCLLGLWLMTAPAIFETTSATANDDQLIGALVVTTAVVAMAEVVRPARYVNMLFGAWLIVGPWLLHGGSTVSRLGGIATGVGLILLSLRRGKVREHYGSWDRRIV